MNQKSFLKKMFKNLCKKKRKSIPNSDSNSEVVEEAVSLREIGISFIAFLQQIADLRAIQGHARGEMISPEMQDNVLVPHNLKEFSIPSRMFVQFSDHNEDTGLMAGRREGRESRDTVFLTSLVP